jgi:hypothetical protein
MEPRRLREILDSMPQQTQIFAGAFGDLFALMTSYIRSEVSESYAQNAQWEIFTSLCMEFQVNEDDLLWLISFLTAGPSRVGRSQLPAAAPSPAGRGPAPSDGHECMPTYVEVANGWQEVPERPEGGYEGLNAAQ